MYTQYIVYVINNWWPFYGKTFVWNIVGKAWTSVIKRDKYRKLQYFLCFLRHLIINCQGLQFLYMSASRTESIGEFWKPVTIFICIKYCIYEEIKSRLHLDNCCYQSTQDFLSYPLLCRTVNVASEANCIACCASLL